MNKFRDTTGCNLSDCAIAMSQDWGCSEVFVNSDDYVKAGYKAGCAKIPMHGVNGYEVVMIYPSHCTQPNTMWCRAKDKPVSLEIGMRLTLAKIDTKAGEYTFKVG